MILDLTQTYSPAVPGFASQVAKTMQMDGWNATTLQIYSHAGTHMDAPVHFGVGSQTIDQLPPERFMGKTWVIDIAIDCDQQLITEHDFIKVADKMEAGDSVLIKTGWYRFTDQKKFRDGLPRISVSLAHWLVAKKVNRLIVEPPSVADVNNINEVTFIHQILLGGDIIIVEGICNTSKLTAETIELITLPLKIKDGDGAPARVIAIQNS